MERNLNISIEFKHFRNNRSKLTSRSLHSVHSRTVLGFKENFCQQERRW